MDVVSKHSSIFARLRAISSRPGKLYLSAFIIGLISGGLAFVLKRMIAALSILMTQNVEEIG
ncbi:MAG: hypothetical protein J6B36_03895, partial [Muribaculaceae bacterium]|nr:hypothetical protein [Muribaculaceae bacterium]